MSTSSKGKLTSAQLSYYTDLFNSINQKINILFDHLNSDFLVTSNKLRKYSSIARDKLQANNFPLPLKNKFSEAVKTFDMIIIELQYHDIIRQKLEHIYTVDTDLTKDLKSSHEKNDPLNTSGFTCVLHDLVDLSYNQIRNIKEEYIVASGKIQKQLFKLWSDREIAIELQMFLFNTANNHKNVTGTLDDILNILEELKHNYQGFKVEISEERRMEILHEVKQLYTMEAERRIFNETFQIEEEFVSDDNIFF